LFFGEIPEMSLDEINACATPYELFYIRNSMDICKTKGSISCEFANDNIYDINY
jgi:hypothetical protein